MGWGLLTKLLHLLGSRRNTACIVMHFIIDNSDIKFTETCFPTKNYIPSSFITYRWRWSQCNEWMQIYNVKTLRLLDKCMHTIRSTDRVVHFIFFLFHFIARLHNLLQLWGSWPQKHQQVDPKTTASSYSSTRAQQARKACSEKQCNIWKAMHCNPNIDCSLLE